MAENNDKANQAAAGKKMPWKTALVLVAVLLVEGLAVSALFWFAGKPAEVRADGSTADQTALLQQPIEVLVVEDRFQNTRTGRTYLYDTQVFIILARQHEQSVAAAMESMKAQINSDIATIFRRAEPAHLLEPELATLRRQISAALTRHLGHDEEGEPIVQEVLIPKCMQYRADL